MLDEELLRSLSKHDLKLNKIEFYKTEDWDHLCSVLYENPSLEKFSLCLPSTLHTDDQSILNMRQLRISALLAPLKRHKNLKEFSLSLGYMDEAVIHDVAQLVEENKNIQVFQLPKNKLEDWHIHLIFSALDESPNIDSINLSRNLLRYESTEMLKILAASRKIIRLDVSDNNLKNSAIRLLLMPKSSDFSKNSIDYLNLSGNYITKFGIHKLRRKLTKPHAVDMLSTSKLFLSNNYIGVQGGKFLGKIFQSGFEFYEVYLENTALKDKGVVFLCTSMENTPIQALNLRRTDIQKNGATALANLIRKSKFLKKVKISYDRIHPENKNIIVEALRYNFVFKKMYCLCDGDGSSRFCLDQGTRNFNENSLDIFKKNHTIEHMYFGKSWSKQDIKIQRDIILEDFSSLNNILNRVEIEVLAPNKDINDKAKIIRELNTCNTLINRIKNFNKFDREPMLGEDVSKEKCALLKSDLELIKKRFKKISRKISLYEEFIEDKLKSLKPILEENVYEEIDAFTGNNRYNIFLTNFMLQKSRQREFLKEHQSDVLEEEKKETYSHHEMKRSQFTMP